LHQDKDEQDLRAPIVSVSLGLPAIFQFGGCSAATRCSGCCWSMAMWWSGAGVAPVLSWYSAAESGHHPETGDCRYNLTFRQAGVPRLK
jgi:alkylated DNA repair protein (DNA oxidative demethylase)